MAVGPESLEVRLLGELEVLRGGKRLALPASKKTRALLAYLCATGKAHLRETLCELLWDGPDDPRAALRWSLTKIRPVLDGAKANRLAADRDRAGFEPHGADVDLLAVRAVLGAEVVAATSIAALTAAVGRFRGPLAEGLDLPGCHRWNAWLVGEREAARALHVAALSSLIERLSVAQPEDALKHARGLLALDPLSESSHVAVVRLLGALGRTREAMDQYERCRRILDSELSARPSAELEQARMALHAARPTAVPPDAQAVVSAAVSAPAVASRAVAPRAPAALARLVGRLPEIAAIDSLIGQARQGQARPTLLVLGDAGAGKTRLLEELDVRVRAAGGTVVTGRAFEAEMVRPYGAWIDALATVGGIDAWRDGGAQPTGDAAGATSQHRERLFETVAQRLGALATAGTMLAVVLDDIQWLDDGSAALLHFVARALDGKPVLLAIGARPGELGDNPAALRLVRTLEREQRLLRLTLSPLDATQTAELVRAIDPDVDPSRVFAECEGNPLFAIELSRALRADGNAASSTIEDTIGERLNRLDESARAVLPWAAALGRSFDPDTLARTSGLPPAGLLTALDHLERWSVLRAGPGGRYDFAHDLVRRAAYRQMSEPRRRLVHLQTARALFATPDASGALAGDIAHHAALGGDAELAARACLIAAERCVRLFAASEAAELARRGLRHLPTLPRALRIQLHIKLLHAYMRSGTARGATLRQIDGELTRVVIEAQDAGLHADAASGLYFLSELRFEDGNFVGAAEVSLRAAEVSQHADPETALRQITDTARCLTLLEREMPRAQQLIQAAEGIAGSGASNILEYVWASGLFCHFIGQVEPAIASMERALALARRDLLRWEEFECLLRLALIDLENGRAAQALERCGALADLAAKMGDGSEVSVAGALSALARLALRQPGAEDGVESALRALRAVDAKGMLAIVLNLAAQSDLGDQRAASAQRRAAEALAMATAVNRRSQMAISRAVLAEVALQGGDAATAADHVHASTGDLSEPLVVSARARAAVTRVALRLHLTIPTPAPTPAQAEVS